MRFKRLILISLGALILVATLMIGYILTISSSDLEMYRHLVESSNAKTELLKEKEYTAKQNRAGTSKAFLFSEGNERRVGFLTSASSLLQYVKTDKHSEMIEEMEGVDMVYQENLSLSPTGEPLQTVVEMKADQAKYYYQQEKLIAERVELKRYELPGHTLPASLEKPFFSGTADKVSVAFENNFPVIQAEKLKAKFTKDAK